MKKGTERQPSTGRPYFCGMCGNVDRKRLTDSDRTSGFEGKCLHHGWLVAWGQAADDCAYYRSKYT